MSNKENSKISAAVNGSEGGEEKILELEQKLGEYMNGWQRAQADYQNLQKETAKWKEDFVQYAKADFILELLPIYSHYKTALNHIPVADQTKDWVQGIKHIFSQLQALFKKLGVEEMVVVGETFDHNFHEAIGQEQDPSQPDEVILREVQPGYLFGGKVLQSAKVIINKINNNQSKTEVETSAAGE